MQKTHNTLSENIRAQAAELLNKHLAAAIDLHGQLKRAHWNVRGPQFHRDPRAVRQSRYRRRDLLRPDSRARRRARGHRRGHVQVAAANSFLVPYPLRLPTKRNISSRSPRLSPHSVNPCARRSDNRRDGRRRTADPSLKYRAAWIVTSGSSNPTPRHDEQSKRLRIATVGRARASFTDTTRLMRARLGDGTGDCEFTRNNPAPPGRRVRRRTGN